MTLFQFAFFRAVAQAAQAVLSGEVFDAERTRRALEWFESAIAAAGDDPRLAIRVRQALRELQKRAAAV